MQSVKHSRANGFTGTSSLPLLIMRKSIHRVLMASAMHDTDSFKWPRKREESFTHLQSWQKTIHEKFIESAFSPQQCKCCLIFSMCPVEVQIHVLFLYILILSFKFTAVAFSFTHGCLFYLRTQQAASLEGESLDQRNCCSPNETEFLQLKLILICKCWVLLTQAVPTFFKVQPLLKLSSINMSAEFLLKLDKFEQEQEYQTKQKEDLIP